MEEKEKHTEEDLKAMEIYLKLGYTKQDFHIAFNNTFKNHVSIDREKGTIEISKSVFLNNKIPPIITACEIEHFDFHVRNKKLRRKISGKRVQEMIDYIQKSTPKMDEVFNKFRSKIENKNIYYDFKFNYYIDRYKRIFWFKLLINKLKNKICLAFSIKK